MDQFAKFKHANISNFTVYSLQEWLTYIEKHSETDLKFMYAFYT